VSGRSGFFIVLSGFIAFRLYDANGEWSNLHFWANTVIQIGIALLLVQLNHVYTIIRSRTLLPALFYLAFASFNTQFAFDLTGSVAALCLTLCHFFLFKTYQNQESQIDALNISILLILGSLICPQLLFFFPVFWFGFYRLRCLNFRVFLASISGVIAVYLFILAWSIYTEDWPFFLKSIPDPKKWFFIQKPDFSLSEWSVIGFSAFIYILSVFNLFLSSLSEKIRTVSILHYLYFSSFAIFFLLIFQSGNKSQWALMINVPLTLLISHFFTLSGKKSVKYLMVISFLFLLGINFWQRFSP
jgi:hypothetical protein